MQKKIWEKAMERLLLKKIGSILVILSLTMIVLLSGITFGMESKEKINKFDELIEQLMESYVKSTVDSKEVIQTFEEDYLNRAYAIAFMLENSQKEITTQELKEIKKLMEVEGVHIIDKNGNIIFSSEENELGSNLSKYKSMKSFFEVLNGETEKDYVIDLNSENAMDEESLIYIGIKVNSEQYSMIQIGIDPNILQKRLDAKSMETVLEAMPTIIDRAVFCVDVATGDIEGITKNNEQTLTFQDSTNTPEEFVAQLKDCQEGKLTKVNGKSVYIKTVEVDGKILGVYESADVVYTKVFISTIYIIVGVIILFGIIMLVFQHYFRLYVLKDLMNIETNIKELMSGNYDVDFKTEYDTEFREICNILNDWKESYRYKTERMTKIMASINERVAVFECLYPINQNFFSDNMKTILGVQEGNWEEIRKTPQQFKEYMKDIIDGCKTEDGIIQMNDKFLSIAFFEENDGLYGMVMDRTEDVELRKEMQEQIQYIKKESETDALTQVTNRSGFERYVKEILKTDSSNGVMIILDLDNFKLVNDKEGHPVGDLVLQKFANCLKSYFRQGDLVGRIGGDEFVVFMKTTMSTEVLVQKLNTLLRNIREELGEYNAKYNLSTSIGVAYTDDKIKEYEELYECADKALYMAKRLGKDRVYICEKNESV